MYHKSCCIFENFLFFTTDYEVFKLNPDSPEQSLQIYSSKNKQKCLQIITLKLKDEPKLLILIENYDLYAYSMTDRAKQPIYISWNKSLIQRCILCVFDSNKFFFYNNNTKNDRKYLTEYEVSQQPKNKCYTCNFTRKLLLPKSLYPPTKIAYSSQRRKFLQESKVTQRSWIIS